MKSESSDQSFGSDEEERQRGKRSGRKKHKRRRSEEREERRTKKEKKKERKKRKREKRKYSDDDSSSYDSYRERKKRERKEKRKRKKHCPERSETTNLERNYALADELCSLLESHPALAGDLPIMLIRLAGGTTFDLSQMTDGSAAAGLARVFACLEPFGVVRKQRDSGPWMWQSPDGAGGSNELVLVRVVRAMLNEIGVTIEAIEAFENPPDEPKETQQTEIESGRIDTLPTPKADKESVERETAKLLGFFASDGEGDLAKEVAGLCTMILEGESIALDGLPNERLRTGLESLFVLCGLEKSEIALDEDDTSDDEDEDSGMAEGYGLPEHDQEEARMRIESVFNLCRDSKPTTVNRRPMKGPMLPATAHIGDTTMSVEEESEDEEGPLPAGEAALKRSAIPSHLVEASAAGRDRQLESVKQGRGTGIAANDGKREEWMLVPGKFDFLGAVKSGQPMRNRKFEAKSRASAEPDQPMVDAAVKAEIDAMRQAHEESRGPSLMEQHRQKKRAEQAAAAAAGKKPSWKWNRDKDLDAGRRVDKDQLNMILGGAGKDLKSKFSSSY
jgi:hypothetical protein